jgi:type I restriction enzyme M protein
MISVGTNFFYTVTLACTLWFFDKGKRQTERGDKVLFIDARNIFQQVSRAHRDFTTEQIEFIANIVRLYRDEQIETINGSKEILSVNFQEGKYVDVPGLCKLVTIEEIKSHGWSLNPGRYVGVSENDEEDYDFIQRLQELNEELEQLNVDANELEDTIIVNMGRIVEGLQHD